jgi:TfoX/Sxy family transcriptional regulator of competence genes
MAGGRAAQESISRAKSGLTAPPAAPPASECAVFSAFLALDDRLQIRHRGFNSHQRLLTQFEASPWFTSLRGFVSSWLDYCLSRLDNSGLDSNCFQQGLVMAYSESLAERIRQVFARQHGITEKKMFGGVGFLLNGNMCVGVWKSSLVVRLGHVEAEAALTKPEVVPFDITGRPMKGWLIVEPDGIESAEQLSQWIQRSVKFVSTLPKK